MSILRVIPFAAAAAVLVLVACSSSSDGSSGSTSTTDAATGTDSSSSTDSSTASDTSTATDSSIPDTSMTACTAFADAGAACNTIVQGGTLKTGVAHAGALPTGTGGTIADGRYLLTSIDTYTGSPVAGVQLNQTLELCGGAGQLVGDEPGKPQYRKSFSFAPSGIAPNVTTTCSTQMPDTNVPYTSYTATTTDITFYSPALTFSVTYTKQ
jgi:hypothetical protein